MDIVSTLVSAGSGGALGLLGSVVGGFFKMKQHGDELKYKLAQLGARKDEYAHELKLQEQQLATKEAETERELAVASYQGMAASIQADASLNNRISGWVANIKSLFRPFLTLLLLGLSGAIVFELGPVDKPELLRYAEQIIFTTCTAISWWFGDRSFAPPSSK